MTQANAQQVERPVPAWIGVAVVVICLAMGGAFLWWYLREPLPSAGEIIPDAGRTVQGGRMAVRPRPRVMQVSPDADGVRISSSSGKTTYNVRADQGKSLMDVDKASSGALSYVYRYQRKDLLTSEQRDLAMVRFRIMQDQAVAQALNVTPDQMQKLSAIPRAIQMELTADDRKNLENLFGQYDQATGSAKPTAEKALTAALKQAGDRSFDATKAKIKERADQITAILKPEQIKKFNEMSGATP